MRDDRGIIVNWLIKVLIGLIIGGVILFDTGSVAVNFFTLDGSADEIANQVASDISQGKFSATEIQSLDLCTRRPTNNKACTEIQQKVKEKSAKLLKVTLDLQNNLKIRIRRTASSLVLKHIGPIEDWATSTAEGEAVTETQ